jgi:N-acetyl-anhydromuramyl-L-alanine amidase AmpD
MARLSSATWRPISINYTSGGIAPRMVIVHIMVGTLTGTDGWFRNPAARVSAHFGTSKDGRLYQWVDTSNKAWHAMSANGFAIGVESEGSPPDKLTDKQLQRTAEVLAWAHKVHGIPLKLAKTASDSGLGWHGMAGGVFGHPACPGANIVAQLPEIVRRAAVLAGEKPPVTPPAPKPANDPVLRSGATGSPVRTLQNLLNKKGAKLAVDGDFGPATLAAVKAFQKSAKLVVDGVVGPATWAALRK